MFADEIRINGNIPFLKDKSITGIGLNHKTVSAVKDAFKTSPYKFIDIDAVLTTLSGDLADYIFPGLDNSTAEHDAKSCISRFVKIPADGACIIRKENSILYCLPIDTDDRAALQDYLRKYLTDLTYVPEIRFSTAEPKLFDDGMTYPDFEGRKRKKMKSPTPLFGWIKDREKKSGKGISNKLESTMGGLFDEKGEGEVLFSEPEPKLDSKARKIISEIEKIQREYGVSIEELEAIISYTVKLSRLHITRNGNIILTDFGNKEIAMDTLSKTFFFLYLKHPEGIRFKDLADHKEELKTIYLGLTGRDDLERIEKSINNLVDPFSNAANVNSSRIKGAFINAVTDRVARFYYIDGPSGSAKKILIDRDYVIWD